MEQLTKYIRIPSIFSDIRNSIIKYSLSILHRTLVYFCVLLSQTRNCFILFTGFKRYIKSISNVYVSRARHGTMAVYGWKRIAHILSNYLPIYSNTSNQHK